ncbi:hypothetical protein CC78DRAFT_572170 [Lojkania enalia]|uniref:Uncharacterized protein n=1 Tax=Lojkania enalia TaxID=147567 RepID=A0A9P4N528_9PLEO|nr:hypothetical protein CC78DRAFT_572170 [Didymosphaeria enalia]
MTTCPHRFGIPNPPTTKAACAIPIGGSNSTILDTCCNGHINPIVSYGAPDGEDCYQFCTTDAVEEVEDCLLNKLGEFNKSDPDFQCFNAVDMQTQTNDSRRRGVGMWLFVALGVVGMVAGTI